MSIDDNIFVEPELEENLDQVLVSPTDFTLRPGYNSVELTSKVGTFFNFLLFYFNYLSALNQSY